MLDPDDILNPRLLPSLSALSAFCRSFDDPENIISFPDNVDDTYPSEDEENLED